MADSKEKNPKLSPDFSEDLDAMLDDAAASMKGTEELMDDDEAIDQLLMDNTLDANEQPDEEGDELDKLLADGSMSLDMDDEFGTELEPILNESQSGKPQVEPDSQGLISNSNEFAEIDEFSDFDEFADEPDEAMPSQENNDFTVAEFDISFDDNSIEETDAVISQHENSTEHSNGPVTVAADSQTGQPSIPDSGRPAESTGIAIDTVAIAAQISQLFSGQSALKQQLEEISVPAEVDHSDEIERLTQTQFALKKQLEERAGKSPFIANVALGISIAAVLMAGVLGYFAWSTGNETEGLTQRMVTLEDHQEASIIKNNDEEINAINAKIDQQNQAISELTTQLAGLAEARSDENGSGSSLSADLSTAQSQQQKLNESITALDNRIKRLETKTTQASNKNIKKQAVKVARSQDWSVNLVSFRQEWYAKRKAAEFSKKGVPTDVIAVQVKGEPWYRLAVKGFKTKAEASAYAAQVKKNFNLDSVWLGKD